MADPRGTQAAARWHVDAGRSSTARRGAGRGVAWAARGLSLLVLMGLLVRPAPTIAAKPTPLGPWQLVGVTDGVTVHTRPYPNFHVPQMRGQVDIDTSIYQVFAVLDDTAKHKVWMARTRDSALVKKLTGWDRFIWTQKRTPWPAQDRDAVMRVRVHVDGKRKRIVSRFRAVTTPLRPKRSGIVRMPRLDGSFTLEALGPKRTRVTYVLLADMGGWIPDWLTRLISRKLPLRDLQGLRKQALATRGAYDAFVRRVNPALGGTMPLDGRPTPPASPPTSQAPASQAPPSTAAPTAPGAAPTPKAAPSRPSAPPAASSRPGT